MENVLLPRPINCKTTLKDLERCNDHKAYVFRGLVEEWQKPTRNRETFDDIAKLVFRRLNDLFFGRELGPTTGKKKKFCIQAPATYRSTAKFGKTTAYSYGKGLHNCVVQINWRNWQKMDGDKVVAMDTSLEGLETFVGTVLHEAVHCHWYLRRPEESEKHEAHHIDFFRDVFHINKKLGLSHSAALSDFTGNVARLERPAPRRSRA